MIEDGAGRTLFSSGELRPDGSIRGNDNDADPLAFEPHHRVIDSPDDVQIYEPILADAGGRVTTGLLSAVRYAKDNRLLPRGFDKATAGDDYAVYGDARDDPDFQGGGDRIVFRPLLPAGASGPFRVEVDLLYQPIRLPLGAQSRALRIHYRARCRIRPVLRGDVRRVGDHARNGERQRLREALMPQRRLVSSDVQTYRLDGTA